MSHFEHLRHKPPTPLDRPRELVIACPQLQSSVNLSRIVRLAGCVGVTRMVCAGRAKLDREIARDAADVVTLEAHRSLPPTLVRLKNEGYRVVGLEQTTGSVSLLEYSFPHRTVLLVGHERHGLTDELLALVDDAVEIPVWGQPYSYNVATATTMAVYEYCRQYPRG